MWTACLRVRVWCCDGEENKWPRSKIIENEEKATAADLPPITSKFHTRSHCGELLLVCSRLLTLLHTVLAAAASSLLYQPSDSTTHADMASADKPRTFLDIDIDGEPAGRLVFELFTDKTPKTCEKYGIN
jgi:hypothetical protein